MVKVITFKTMHSIVCDFEESKNPGMVKIKKPAQIISTHTAGNYAFIPFLEFTKEFDTGIEISTETILSITTPILDTLNGYNKYFGSGIEIISSLK